MANRTLRFYGYGYGSDPATLTVTQDGTTIFNNAVTTTAGARKDPADHVVLFTAEVPVKWPGVAGGFTGSSSFAVTVNNGSVSLGAVTCNYVASRNTAYSDAQYAAATTPGVTRQQLVDIYSAVANSPFSQEEIDQLLVDDVTAQPAQQAILHAHNASLASSSGPDGFVPTAGIGMASLGDGYSAPVAVPVYINGNQKTIVNPSGGNWIWPINAGDTIEFDIALLNGVE